MSDADAEYIAQWDRARAMDYKGLYDDPEEEAPQPNRAQRRAQDRAVRRDAATPAKAKLERPTYAQMLLRLLADWDLTFGVDERGEPAPWPITLENIEKIDFAIRLDMLTSIMEDYVSRPNLTTLSKRYSAATTGTGSTTPTSLSSPDGSTDPVYSPGSSSATPNGVAAPSGATG